MAIQACGKIENKRQLDDFLFRIKALVKGRETAEMNEQISKLRKAFSVEGLRDRISIGNAVTMLQKQIERFEREGEDAAFYAERFQESSDWFAAIGQAIKEKCERTRRRLEIESGNT